MADYNIDHHKELIIISQNLRAQGKFLSGEDEKQLLKYEVQIEESVFFANRENFLYS